MAASSSIAPLFAPTAKGTGTRTQDTNPTKRKRISRFCTLGPNTEIQFNREMTNLSAPSLLPAVLLLCAGCVTPAVQPARPPVEAIHTRLAIQGGWISAEVRVPKNAAGPVPAVISPLNRDSDLLRAGIATVRFHTHWEVLRGFQKNPEKRTAAAEDDQFPGSEEKPLVGRWILAADRPGIIGQGYFGIIGYEARKAVPGVLDALRLVPAIDPERVGIAGSSTTGFLALQAMAHDKRIKAGFVFAATGDYHCFLRYSNLALNNDPRWLPDGEMKLDAEYEAALEDRAPGNHLSSFPPRRLLLITGEDDPAIPARCVERFTRGMQAAYRDANAPDAFEWVELEDVSHSLPPETLGVARAFWQRTLRKSTPRR
jgi:pimeloyl-ACP methyl ester carboxylesterase